MISLRYKIWLASVSLSHKGLVKRYYMYNILFSTGCAAEDSSWIRNQISLCMWQSFLDSQGVQFNFTLFTSCVYVHCAFWYKVTESDIQDAHEAHKD